MSARNNRTHLIIILLFVSTLWSCSKKQGPIAENGMVATAHPLATEVSLEVLKKGGNAFDAAVASHFALAVVFPRAGNIGGGGFAVFRKNDGEVGALDFREKAPMSATRDMYLDSLGDIVPKLSTEGHLAAGVPGSVDGILKLHETYGTLPLAELIQPAIELARNGFPITAEGARELNEKQDVIAKFNGAGFYLAAKPWAAGDTIRFADLATTLELIRDSGRAGFYEGKTANLIVKEMSDNGGLITHEDLASYESAWRQPLTANYRGHKVISMPPPSSGGVAVIQLLKGAEAYDIRQLGHNTTKTIHLMTELERRAYADRATYLGDPDHYDVPVEKLTSDAYIQQRFGDISLDEKTDSQDIKEGEVEIIESIETTHYSVVDKEGNAVSVTTTLNGFYGCKVMVDGAGFFLNNEMDDFSSKPGVPNQFGLVGGEANAIAPEKRMLSSMTPTIVEKDGQLKMVVGSPGGSTIITLVFQTILNVIDHEMGMQEAVDAAKTHSQWLPDIVLVEEEKFMPGTLKALERKGHIIQVRKQMGSLDCILVREDGTLEGGADNTRFADNTAAGY